MSNKKTNAKKDTMAAVALTGRVAGMKIGQDSCEFYMKDGKNGIRQFVVNGKGGLQFNAVVELLSAAWAGNRKITVHPASADALEKTIVSITAGTLPKPPKSEKPAKVSAIELAAVA